MVILEIGRHNIRMNLVNPTWVMTERAKNAFAQGNPADKLSLERPQMPRLREKSEIVRPYFILS